MVRPPAPAAPPVPLVDAEHPYFLSSGDNPGLLIVPAVLTGAADYYSWARSLRMALMSKNKLGFIDGTESPPAPSDPLYHAKTTSPFFSD
ncbi:hypothetical protein LINGRAHAP2_LOCUS21185 [Linum grandiflorum]